MCDGRGFFWEAILWAAGWVGCIEREKKVRYYNSVTNKIIKENMSSEYKCVHEIVMRRNLIKKS